MKGGASSIAFPMNAKEVWIKFCVTLLIEDEYRLQRTWSDGLRE